MGCFSGEQEAEYRVVVEHVVAWCGNNHVILNVNKTKEMIADCWSIRNKPNISVIGEELEVVDKNLCVHLSNRPNWRRNTNAVYKKGQSRLYFLKKLRPCSVCSKMMFDFEPQ